MLDRVVGADDRVFGVDDAAAGAGLQILRGDRLVGARPVGFQIGLEVVAGAPFENAVQRIAAGFQAIDDIARDVGEEIADAILVEVVEIAIGILELHPAGGAGLMAFDIAILKRARHQDAGRAVGEGVAADDSETRVHMVANVGIDGLGGAGEIRLAAIVERPARDDANGAADAAFGHVGGRGLHDFQPVDEFGRQVAEIDVAAAADRGRERGRAVDFDPVEAGIGAADGDARAFAVGARNLHAGHALERFADILVRELADILGRDGVEHLGRVALGVERALKAGADAGDDDVGDLIILRGLILGRDLLRGEGKRRHSRQRRIGNRSKFHITQPHRSSSLIPIFHILDFDCVIWKIRGTCQEGVSTARFDAQRPRRKEPQRRRTRSVRKRGSRAGRDSERR